MMEFKDKLFDLMNEKEISSAEKLSKALNGDISPNAIRNYLKGIKPQSMYYYEILAKFFNVDTDFLYNDSNENRKVENKSIGQELGLSDEVIQILKHFNNDNKINYVNSFLKDFIFSEIINSLLFFDMLEKAESKLCKINLYSEKIDIKNIEKNLKEVFNLFSNCNTYPVFFTDDINVLLSECKKYTKSKNKKKQLEIMRNMEIDLLNKMYQLIRVQTYDLTYYFSRYIREYTKGTNEVMGVV